MATSLNEKIAAAKACGLSYGYYVAKLYEENSLPRSVTVPEGNRFICNHCGIVFFRNDNYKPKFCCAECREAAQRKAYRKKHAKRTVA